MDGQHSVIMLNYLKYSFRNQKDISAPRLLHCRPKSHHQLSSIKAIIQQKNFKGEFQCEIVELHFIRKLDKSSQDSISAMVPFHLVGLKLALKVYQDCVIILYLFEFCIEILQSIPLAQCLIPLLTIIFAVFTSLFLPLKSHFMHLMKRALILESLCHIKSVSL